MPRRPRAAGGAPSAARRGGGSTRSPGTTGPRSPKPGGRPSASTRDRGCANVPAGGRHRDARRRHRPAPSPARPRPGDPGRHPACRRWRAQRLHDGTGALRARPRRRLRRGRRSGRRRPGHGSAGQRTVVDPRRDRLPDRVVRREQHAATGPQALPRRRRRPAQVVRQPGRLELAVDEEAVGRDALRRRDLGGLDADAALGEPAADRLQQAEPVRCASPSPACGRGRSRPSSPWPDRSARSGSPAATRGRPSADAAPRASQSGDRRRRRRGP